VHRPGLGGLPVSAALRGTVDGVDVERDLAAPREHVVEFETRPAARLEIAPARLRMSTQVPGVGTASVLLRSLELR
jgi:hypothetical protein